MEKKNKVSESIFDGDNCIIPMADVSFIEKRWIKTPTEGKTKQNWDGLIIVMKHSFWDMEADTWAHNAYLGKEEGKRFLQCWCFYRHEVECVG